MQLAFQMAALAFSSGTRIYIIWMGRLYVVALRRLLQTSTWRQIYRFWVNFSQSLQGTTQVARLQEEYGVCWRVQRCGSLEMGVGL